MKRLKRTYSRCALWTLAALLLCMIAGSFFDLPLSKLLYPGHENSLGQFFAAFGELPAFLALTCSGCLLLVYRERINPSWSALTAVCGAALILMGLVLNIREASDNVPDMPVWVSILVTVFAAAATGAGIVYYARGASAKTVVRFVLTLVVVSIGTMFLINLIKVPWGRVRMRQIYKTSESYFTPWWQAGSTLKKKLMAEGVSSDEFRSFPSGHTACAACAMLIGLLPTLRKGKEKRTKLLFIVGCLWAAAVAISRIWMGAHFLTDVTMAWLIALGMCALCVHLFYFDKRFFAKLWRVLSTSANPFLPKKRSVESPDSEPEN